MQISTVLSNALKLKYKGEIAHRLANIKIYLNQSVGIGEHPDIIEAIDMELDKLATAEDKLKCINEISIQ